MKNEIFICKEEWENELKNWDENKDWWSYTKNQGLIKSGMESMIKYSNIDLNKIINYSDCLKSDGKNNIGIFFDLDYENVDYLKICNGMRKVLNDLSIRNNNFKIIQFKYGELRKILNCIKLGKIQKMYICDMNRVRKLKNRNWNFLTELNRVVDKSNNSFKIYYDERVVYGKKPNIIPNHIFNKFFVYD